MKTTYKLYAIWYFFLYFALATFIPFISPFLLERGLSGSEIGSILALGSLGMILFQPIFGYTFDYLGKNKIVIYSLLILAIISSLIISSSMEILIISIGYFLMRSCYAPILPISDSITLESSLDFGSIRLWGAIGFAVGSQITSLIAEAFGLSSIFPLFIIIILIVGFIVTKINITRKDVKEKKEHIDIKSLFRNTDYLIFLFASFIISGTITGGNMFFAILFDEVGGSVAGVGLAFLLFAGSEAPIMGVLKKVKDKFSLQSLLIFANIIFIGRYFWYSSLPSPKLILGFFFIQGLCVGLSLVVSSLFISEIVPKELKTTALSIYFSVASGLGAMFIQYVSGKILDAKGISAVFFFYGVAACFALVAYIILYVRHRRSIQTN